MESTHGARNADALADEWAAEWRRRIDCWWTLTPHRESLKACIGTLGLILAQRFESLLGGRGGGGGGGGGGECTCWHRRCSGGAWRHGFAVCMVALGRARSALVARVAPDSPRLDATTVTAAHSARTREIALARRRGDADSRSCGSDAGQQTASAHSSRCEYCASCAVDDGEHGSDGWCGPRSRSRLCILAAIRTCTTSDETNLVSRQAPEFSFDPLSPSFVFRRCTS